MKTDELVFTKDKYNTNEGKKSIRKTFLHSYKAWVATCPSFQFNLFVNWDVLLYCTNINLNQRGPQCATNTTIWASPHPFVYAAPLVLRRTLSELYRTLFTH